MLMGYFVLSYRSAYFILSALSVLLVILIVNLTVMF